jgi:uncharacterized protein YkwD
MTLPDHASAYTRRSLLVLGAASLLAACTAALPVIPAGARTPETMSPEEIASAINAVRRANGRTPWAYNPRLASAAKTHSNLMASRDTLSHKLGTTLRQRVTAAGYTGAVGENVAKGYRSIETAIEGWLASPGHRSTLLSDKFVEFGLAVSRTGSGKLYWTMIAGGSFDAWRA